MTVWSFTPQGSQKRHNLRAREGYGTPSEVVKYVDIRKNTKGEGSILARF